ncbi:MAG: tail fiber protein [Thermoanaerobaculaceae bacterium]|nr:tail fiber protein [Thermoanaerobaculaceae bacterium]TAM56725.1 MAG: phage tail protein [Acidobacteriota bacterium]
MNARTKRVGASLVVGLAVLSSFLATTARAQATDPFLGQIMWVGFNFCPQGWAVADGSILSIQQNTALFSLLGTTYGGNGTQNFALPDLRGRVPVGVGQGPGLQYYTLGQMAGEEAHTLTINEMPGHSHPFSLFVSSGKGNQPAPVNGSYLAAPASGDRTYASAAPSTVPLAVGNTGVTGGGQPHNNMQPYLVLTPCIAVTGVFPSRP